MLHSNRWSVCQRGGREAPPSHRPDKCSGEGLSFGRLISIRVAVRWRSYAASCHGKCVPIFGTWHSVLVGIHHGD
ncbi:hypothetical protein CEXT_154401 [Caerostris extrusa]|uniref:Uncharacterized protein n=1 Tax=Caerostris extrusa TaxID=172846 RepID=A0AAV4XL11_CAEEX|nr:hypothetical protein CEXT_154401 [Caerostris extrusa]